MRELIGKQKVHSWHDDFRRAVFPRKGNKLLSSNSLGFDLRLMSV
jgi:hypothetical protein